MLWVPPSESYKIRLNTLMRLVELSNTKLEDKTIEEILIFVDKELVIKCCQQISLQCVVDDEGYLTGFATQDFDKRGQWLSYRVDALLMYLLTKI